MGCHGASATSVFESGRGKGECVVHQYISTSSGVVFSVSEFVSGKLDTDSESGRHDCSSASFTPASDCCGKAFLYLPFLRQCADCTYLRDDPALTGTHPRARQVMERRTGVITLAYLISLGKQCRRFSSTQRVCTFLGERAKDMGKETTSLWSVLLDQGHVAMYSIYCTMTPLCRKARVNEAQRTS